MISGSIFYRFNVEFTIAYFLFAKVIEGPLTANLLVFIQKFEITLCHSIDGNHVVHPTDTSP